jgi:hypothetical protein
MLVNAGSNPTSSLLLNQLALNLGTSTHTYIYSYIYTYIFAGAIDMYIYIYIYRIVYVRMHLDFTKSAIGFFVQCKAMYGRITGILRILGGCLVLEGS